MSNEETKEILRNLLEQWGDEYDDLKLQLQEKGEEASSFEYNLMATRAMVLAECRLDASGALLEMAAAEAA